MSNRKYVKGQRRTQVKRDLHANRKPQHNKARAARMARRSVDELVQIARAKTLSSACARWHLFNKVANRTLALKLLAG